MKASKFTDAQKAFIIKASGSLQFKFIAVLEIFHLALLRYVPGRSFIKLLV